MKCSKCKNNKFFIELEPCCEECEANAAFDPDLDEYIYDLEIIESKDLERNHVNREGECDYGSTYGAGCHMYICTECTTIINMPFVEGD